MRARVVRLLGVPDCQHDSGGRFIDLFSSAVSSRGARVEHFGLVRPARLASAP